MINIQVADNIETKKLAWQTSPVLLSWKWSYLFIFAISAVD